MALAGRLDFEVQGDGLMEARPTNNSMVLICPAPQCFHLQASYDEKMEIVTDYGNIYDALDAANAWWNSKKDTLVKEEYWTNASGEKVAVDEMSVDHLRNTLRYILRNDLLKSKAATSEQMIDDIFGSLQEASSIGLT